MRRTELGNKERHAWIYYAMLVFVVLFWGVSSVFYTYIYRHYSASALGALLTFFSALVFILLSFKKRLRFDCRYVKIALPICLLNGIACLLQRIGLQYTTPASYAFLEHLSCVVVPIMMFAFLRKKPTFLQALAGILCLVGCFILSGLSVGGLSFGVGDALCATAGVLLGVVIAAIGAYTKELDITLFMTVHMVTYFFVSFCTALLLHFMTVDGVPMETLRFSFNPLILLPVILFGVVDIALCWMLRTEAIKHVDPTTVAIISPFSAVVTGLVSVLVGTDEPSANLLVGGILILAALLLPEIFQGIDRKKP